MQSAMAGGVNVKNYNLDALNAAAAGYIMCATTNFALIIFIGLGAAIVIPEMHLPGKFGMAMSNFQTRPEPAYHPQPNSSDQF